MFLDLNVIGRVIFGLYFIYSGLNHFILGKGMIGYATMKKVPLPIFAVYGSGVLMILGGIGVTLGISRDLSLAFILLFLIPVTVLMHDFWNDVDENTKMNNKINFLKNVALIGATLAMF